MSIQESAWFRDLTNKEKHCASQPVALPPARRREWLPSGYLPDKGLAGAIQVALLLRKPLLLTGEPGTGKTECAAYLAWKLGYRPPLEYASKSTSEARDLFYSYDTLGRFHAKEADGPPPDPRAFITYNALGEAILRTLPRAAMEEVVPPEWTHREPEQSVVLIDEIDKAPRDFPNDLLNEIDRLYFRVPELKNARKEADRAREPVLVITSNSEKNLPAAFLRRCVYYHIPFPEGRLEEIAASRMTEFAAGASQLLKDAIAFFLYLRTGEAGLEKPPATAELLDWLLYLRQSGRGVETGLKASSQPGLVTLLKHERDQKRDSELWEAWRSQA